MSRTTLTLFGLAGLLLMLPLIGAASTKPYGPPWIAVELPANPLDPATRDAALVIRTYRHDRPESFPLTGTAEGIVRNERRSVPLEFEPTGQPGVFRVDQTWPAEGNWLVAVSAGDDATMVIELGGNDGGVNRTSYYGQRATGLSIRSIHTGNRRPSMRQINQNLRELALASE
jgi:hypothetical protein